MSSLLFPSALRLVFKRSFHPQTLNMTKPAQNKASLDRFGNVRGLCNHKDCNCKSYDGEYSNGLSCAKCEHYPVDHTLDAKSKPESEPLGKSNDNTIYFYERDAPYYEFTNFYEGPPIVDENGQSWTTSEHMFQAQKFLPDHPEVGEKIREARTPRIAFDLAHRFQSKVRADWMQTNVEAMDKVLAVKFGTNETLKQLLVDTKDATLVERSPFDAFWGDGADGTGRNELGKALMRLREKLASNDVEKRRIQAEL